MQIGQRKGKMSNIVFFFLVWDVEYCPVIQVVKKKEKDNKNNTQVGRTRSTAIILRSCVVMYVSKKSMLILNSIGHYYFTELGFIRWVRHSCRASDFLFVSMSNAPNWDLTNFVETFVIRRDW